MGLPAPSNVTVKIYTGSSANNPYTFGALRSQVKGVLIPAVQGGRLGSASWLKWTHILLLDKSVKIQDAYNSQLDPARNNQSGDTVVVTDSGGPNQTAYYVVFVEQIARGTSAQHQRVYLDRFQPNAWPNDGT
jgi:hypothetical protein